MKRMLSAYLLALISGTQSAVEREADADHLRGAPAQHLLEHALVRGVPRSACRSRAAACSTIAAPSRIGSERRDPAPAGRASRASALAMQPEVVRGQVELADAARNAGALLDRHQPFVVAQVLADLARPCWSRPAMRLLDVAHAPLSSACWSISGLARNEYEHLLLALELLQEVGLEVGAAGDVEDLEQREQRRVMLGRLRSARGSNRARSNRSSSRSSVRMRSLSGYS